MKFYRYESDSYYSGGDEDGYGGMFFHRIVLKEFDLEKETPKGYWIRGFMTRKWVSKTHRKRFAFPSKLEAIQSFIIRKEWAVHYADARTIRQQKFLSLGQAELNILQSNP